ncbi:MAG: hypothetical protein PHW56_04605 [Methanosarcinaceae archaeon]|nr:hypothetical protein [Methanosarcinaceae archaeon]
MPHIEPPQENFKIPRGYDTSVIKLYFWLGLVSAALLRIIIIADHHNPLYAKVIWYLGVAGYLWFFAHRYHIAERRFGVVNYRSAEDRPASCFIPRSKLHESTGSSRRPGGASLNSSLSLGYFPVTLEIPQISNLCDRKSEWY